jgi:hypothetical protein
MITPSRRDLGWRVVYTAVGTGATEPGTIVSFNDGYVFVLYDNQGPVPKATARENLAWAQP